LRYLAAGSIVPALALHAGAHAADNAVDATFDLAETASEAAGSMAAAPGEAAQQQQSRPEPQQGPPTNGPGRTGPAGGPQGGMPPFRIVFDETWATVGVGAGLVPSYSGSDDYIVFPLPLITGRVAGIGITPNGPGFNLNLLSQGPRATLSRTTFSFGPSFRFRNDRAQQVEDEVVELATELDVAIEVGANAGVSFAGVLTGQDRLGVGAQVRWDVLGAHEGMLFEPGITYFTPVGRGSAVQLAVNASFVDDNFADYYYTVTPADAAATGLAQFTADGGLNSLGALGIMTFDLDGNLLNGGFNIYTVVGYTRLVGDAADTPFTSVRGSSNQFIGGLGVGFTF
jgi:outer membrane scaffolding protein for murein synthesis (MipA/OmpV family)